VAATKVAPEGSRRRLLARYDVSVAFFHAPGEGKIAIMPPKELRKPGICWFLDKAMYGTRRASQLFGTYVIDSLCAEGMKCIGYMAMTFVSEELDIELAVHGDDFLADGEKDSLDQLDTIMEKYFDVKRLPRIGPPEFGGEVTHGDHLKCTISWSAKGFTWEGNPKHVKDLMDLMGFTESTKGIDTPSAKDTGKGVRTSLDELDDTAAWKFRSGAGTLQYIAQDVVAVKQATAEVMQGMAIPLEIHQLRLARAARYLHKYPGEVWHYDYQSNPGVLDEICDSDWAGDPITRKSTSCIVERFGKHMLDTSVNKQKPIALSSGEAEFYPIVKAGAQAIQSQGTLKTFGMGDVRIRIHSDSSAARGIVQRQGPGKLRHLDIKDLWIQDFIREKKAEIVKILTDVNWADIGTKPLTKARLEELLAMMPISRREGLDWAVKASTVLAFFAGMGVVEAGPLVTVQESSLQLNEPNAPSRDPRWIFAAIAYVVVIHILAMMTLLRGWRWLRNCRRSVAASDDSRRQSGTVVESGVTGAATSGTQSSSRKLAENLVAGLTNDQLKEMNRARGLPVSGRKQELVQAFFGSRSRATDSQLAQMARLLERNHRLRPCARDFDSVAAASAWLASVEQPRQRAKACA